MKKKSFTLIELLVVIAVIGILAAMLMPALNGVKTKGKITKARAEMNAILTAIKQYEADYGVLPLTGAHTESTGKVKDDDSYDRLMEYLTCIDINGSGVAATDAKNPRQIRYLDAPATFSSKSFLDPFGNRYVIFLDVNYDGKIDGNDSTNGVNIDNSTNTSGNPTFTTADVFYGSVCIYSYGPNGQNQSDINKKDQKGTWTGSTNDDIASWR